MEHGHEGRVGGRDVHGVRVRVGARVRAWDGVRARARAWALGRACVRRLGGNDERPRRRRARTVCLPMHSATWVREGRVAAAGIVGVQRGGGGAVMNAVTQERTRGWRWA